MRSRYSRRRVLRTIGSGVTVLTAGCFDAMGQSASDSHTLSATESNGDHTSAQFTSYVTQMESRHGDHGVWGLDTPEKSTAGLSFVGAWSDGWTLRTTQGTSNGRSYRTTVNYAAVLYRLSEDPGPDPPGHRLWLWAVGSPPPSNTDGGNAGDVTLVELSLDVTIDSGRRTGLAPTTDVGPDVSPVRIALGNPPSPPNARRPIPAGRLQPSEHKNDDGFRLGWAGIHRDTISIAGVCELEREGDAEFAFTLKSEASGSRKPI